MRLVDMFEAVEGNAEEKLAGQISLTENWLVAILSCGKPLEEVLEVD